MRAAMIDPEHTVYFTPYECTRCNYQQISDLAQKVVQKPVG